MQSKTEKFKKKHEAIIIKSRYGKTLEVKIVPVTQKMKGVKLDTDNFVHGSMQVKRIPERYAGIVDILISSDKLEEFEGFIRFILQ